MKDDCALKVSGDLPEGYSEDRHAFDVLFTKWSREIIDYADPDTPHERIMELEKSSKDMELARSILIAPIPLGFMMAKKLDVIIHYMATIGEKMDVHERIVFSGICALRADIVHFCG